MKRNNLTTAVVAAIAGVAGFASLANAVDLNPDGLGQVLIYPYYTVNANQNSLFSVVNTDSLNGKAVKVRFLEGYNSREVLDFNLYLSPNDVWTAAVVATSATGGAAVFTNDHSCTNPAIPSTGVPFRSSAYDGTAGGAFPADGGPTSITRTREGYLELISMGDIIPGSALDLDTRHVQNGSPDGGVPPCGTSIGNGAGAFLVAPTGGLFGAGSVVNVNQGTFYGYDADAIDGFSTSVLFSGSGGLTPSLKQANSSNSTFPTGAVAYVFTGGGTLLTLDYANGVDAVSAVFASDAIYNEYLTEQSIAAATDWVVTFPTKRFYVDSFYVGATAVQPFVETFGQNIAGQSNVEVGISIYDREEGTTTSSDDFSPPTSHPSALPYEVNVISFLAGTDPNAGVTSGVFGSKLVSNIAPYGGDGWLNLNLANGDSGAHVLRASANGDVLHGLPATGFEAYNVINANANPGLLANYSGLFRHRASRNCTNVAGVCS